MEIKNEYLEKLIREKLFKDFDKWEKDDYHFLLSLLNYPNYCTLSLIILTNLKNWIQYSSGHFFYTIDHVEKILNKFDFNYDIYNDIINNNDLNKENIKINIEKKKDDKNDKNDCKDKLFHFDDELNIFHLNEWVSVDIFSFSFWVILFIIYLFIKILFNPDKNNLEYNLNNDFMYNYLDKNEKKEKTNEFNIDFKIEDILFSKNKYELINKCVKYIYQIMNKY